MRRLLLCLFIMGCFLIGGPEIATAEKWAVAAEAASQRIEVDEDSIVLVLGNSRAVCQAKFISKGMAAVSKVYVDFPSKSFACVDIMMIDAAGNQVAASQGDPEMFAPIQANTLGESLYYFLQAYRDVTTLPNPKRL